jgi:hypothetical protein
MLENIPLGVDPGHQYIPRIDDIHVSEEGFDGDQFGVKQVRDCPPPPHGDKEPLAFPRIAQGRYLQYIFARPERLAAVYQRL